MVRSSNLHQENTIRERAASARIRHQVLINPTGAQRDADPTGKMLPMFWVHIVPCSLWQFMGWALQRTPSVYDSDKKLRNVLETYATDKPWSVLPGPGETTCYCLYPLKAGCSVYLRRPYRNQNLCVVAHFLVFFEFASI